MATAFTMVCAGCGRPPPTVQSYTPPPTGTTWTLKLESTGSFGSGTSFLTVERGERNWNGQPVITFDTVSSTRLATAMNETIAWVVGDEPIRTMDPPLGLPWPLHVGRKHKSAHRLTTHWNNQTTPFEVEQHVQAYEDVTVPAGTFKAFRIRITNTLGEQEIRWFNPERGQVVKQSLNRNESWPGGMGTLEVELAPPRSEPMRRIGFLWSGFVSGDSPGPFFERSLAQGLRELGWENGKNAIFIHRYNKDASEEQGLRNVEDLIRLKADVIVDDWGAVPARLTKSIPIVTLSSPDPVRIGVADSYARPGRNVTGMAVYLDGKDSSTPLLNLELLMEAVPSASRLALLVPAKYPYDACTNVGPFVRAFKRRKLDVHLFEIKSVDDIEPAFSEARRRGVHAVWVDPVGVLGPQQVRRLTALALSHRLPLAGYGTWFAQAGGLIGAGFDYDANLYRAATYIDKILKGAKPGDLPFEQPSRILVAVNLKTAKALGLTLPKSVTARADEVIE